MNRKINLSISVITLIAAVIITPTFQAKDKSGNYGEIVKTCAQKKSSLKGTHDKNKKLSLKTELGFLASRCEVAYIDYCSNLPGAKDKSKTLKQKTDFVSQCSKKMKTVCQPCFIK